MSAPLLCVCVGGVCGVGCVYVGVWVSECSSLVCVCVGGVGVCGVGVWGVVWGCVCVCNVHIG